MVKTALPALLTLLLLSSCSISKRRYMQGWQICRTRSAVQHFGHHSAPEEKKSPSAAVHLHGSEIPKTIPQPVPRIEGFAELPAGISVVAQPQINTEVRDLVIKHAIQPDPDKKKERKIPAPGSTASLGLGLLAVVFPIAWLIIFSSAPGVSLLILFATAFTLCLASIISGTVAMQELRRNPDRLTGRSTAVLGLSLSWLVFSHLSIALMIVLTQF